MSSNPFGLSAAQMQNPNVQTVATLVEAWQQSTGFKIPVSAQDVVNMATTDTLPGGGNAGHPVTSAFDVGQWMSDMMVIQHSNAMDAMPWAAYGLTEDSYRSLHADYATTYKQMTGQDISEAELAKAFTQGSGEWTATQYEQALKNRSDIQNQFGWVKYGLDYLSFQQQKLKMNPAFGHQLTDQEGVAQLQQWHVNQGSDYAAHGAESQQVQERQKAGSLTS